MTWKTSFAVAVGLVLLSPWAVAQTPSCDQLKGAQKELAQEILSSQHPYDCCDDTLLLCLQKKPVCSLAFRLAENVCRRVNQRQNREQIVRGLSRRALSMLGGMEPAKINVEGVPSAGQEQAGVTLVMYGCARCPFCSQITPKLHAAVVSGSLLGKVKLFYKIFPVRSHPFSKESGLAFLAAAALGRFWDYLLYYYQHFDEFQVEKIAPWAQAVGLDRAEFEKSLQAPQTRQILVANKKEGILNKVEVTPTFFINGKKYQGDLNLEEIIDVLEEEFDRVKGVIYQ